MAMERRAGEVAPDSAEDPWESAVDAVRRALRLAGAEGKSIEIALSGGPDSVFLAGALADLREPLGLALGVCHVHHGLQSVAESWVAFCEGLAVSLRMPFRLVRLGELPRGMGVEAAARAGRYAALAQSKADFVALAHHRDDQIETFLLGALRGGGPRAMAAMPLSRPLPRNGAPTGRGGSGPMLLRPMLGLSRAQIEGALASRGLAYVVDPTNNDERYLRNWVRLRLLPLMRERLPSIDAHLLSCVEACAAASRLIDGVAEADLAALGQFEGWGGNAASDGVEGEGRDAADRRLRSLDLKAWSALPQERRAEALRAFVRRSGLGSPEKSFLLETEAALSARPSGRARFRAPGGLAVADRGRLWAWTRDDPLLLLGAGEFTFEPPRGGARFSVGEAGREGGADGGSAPLGPEKNGPGLICGLSAVSALTPIPNAGAGANAPGAPKLGDPPASLSLRWAWGKGGIADWDRLRPCRLRAARPGDRLKIGPDASKDAFRLLAEKGIPAFVRPFWPLIVSPDGAPVCLAGARVDARFAGAWGWLPQMPAARAFIPPVKPRPLGGAPRL